VNAKHLILSIALTTFVGNVFGMDAPLSPATEKLFEAISERNTNKINQATLEGADVNARKLVRRHLCTWHDSLNRFGYRPVSKLAPDGVSGEYEYYQTPVGALLVEISSLIRGNTGSEPYYIEEILSKMLGELNLFFLINKADPQSRVSFVEHENYGVSLTPMEYLAYLMRAPNVRFRNNSPKRSDETDEKVEPGLLTNYFNSLLATLAPHGANPQEGIKFIERFRGFFVYSDPTKDRTTEEALHKLYETKKDDRELRKTGKTAKALFESRIDPESSST
jgi:hypothetical protein